MKMTKRVKTILECLNYETREDNPAFEYAISDFMTPSMIATVGFITACLELPCDDIDGFKAHQLNSVRRTLKTMVDAGLIERFYKTTDGVLHPLPQREYYYHLQGQKKLDDAWMLKNHPPLTEKQEKAMFDKMFSIK